MPISSANSPIRILILMRHATRAGGLDTLASQGHQQAEGFPDLLRAKLTKLAQFVTRDSAPNFPSDPTHDASAIKAPENGAGHSASETSISWRVHASPKVRTQQTLRFLNESLRSQKATLRSEVLEHLDERKSGETQIEFESRVRNLLDGWHDEMRAETIAPESRTTDHKVLVACSHLDWLEAAAIFLGSDESDAERSAPWPPLETRIYFLENGIWNRFRR